MRRQPATPSQPFEIICGCGIKASGLRLPGHQAIPCSRCGEVLFVLPVNVYPTTAASAARSRRQGTKRNAPLNAAVTVEPPRRPGRLAQSARAVPAKAAGAMRKVVARPVTLVRSAARAVFTPFRLVLLSILAVVIGTSYWAWQGRQIEQAAVALKDAVERGNKALAAGDFLSAGDNFRIAVEAIERIGRDDPEARSLRQVAREMDAASHLAVASLPDIAEEFVNNRKNGEQRAADAFRVLHGGRWIVIDAKLVRAPAGGTSDRLLLDFPISIEGRRCYLDADVPVLRRLAQSTPRRVIFAGQLEFCRPAGGRSPAFSIHFRPETAFVWCHFHTLPAVGFGTDEVHKERELRQLLAEQCRLMEVEP